VDREQALHALGLPDNAGAEQVRQAFRLRARQVHPDLSSDPGATLAMARLIAARNLLLEGGPVPGAEPAAPPPSRVGLDGVLGQAWGRSARVRGLHARRCAPRIRITPPLRLVVTMQVGDSDEEC